MCEEKCGCEKKGPNRYKEMKIIHLGEVEDES